MQDDEVQALDSPEPVVKDVKEDKDIKLPTEPFLEIVGTPIKAPKIDQVVEKVEDLKMDLNDDKEDKQEKSEPSDAIENHSP